MPYKRKGRVVYVKSAGRWKKKGSSKTVAGAKRYLKKLHMVSGH